MKNLLIAAAVIAAPSAAIAGPYVNLEGNSSFSASNYQGTVLETHVGFESDLGESSSWYIQAGPAFVSVDGEGTTTEYSGKVGVSVELTERISAYGEVAAMTQGEGDFDEDLNYGVKVGATYRF